MISSIRSLNKIDRDEILEDMQDWELYMRYKEHHEYLRQVSINQDLPGIRAPKSSLRNGTPYIKFNRLTKVSSPSNIKTTDLCNANTTVKSQSFLSDFAKIEIKPHDLVNGEVNEEEEKRKIKLAELERKRGNEAFEKGEFEKAYKYYSNCLLYFNCINAYNNRAQASMKMRNHSCAILDLDEVLRQDPLNEKALYRRAVCRENIGMFREALSDAEILVKYHPENSSGRNLSKKIKRRMTELKGKFYRIRENFGAGATFEIEASQLSAYAGANSNSNYLVEVDKTGCDKKCICGYCTSDDRLTRTKYIGLRIGERVRWKLITVELILEMKNNSSDLQESAVKVHNAVKRIVC